MKSGRHALHDSGSSVSRQLQRVWNNGEALEESRKCSTPSRCCHLGAG